MSWFGAEKQKEDLAKSEEEFQAMAMKNGWRACPECGLMQERVYGDFHMVCANPQCKTEYCHDCGEKLEKNNWQQHYKIGKCKLWKSEYD